MAKYGGVLLLLSVLFSTGCSQSWRRSARVNALDPVAPGTFRWENPDLRVELRIDQKNRFHWRFQNLSLIPVALLQDRSRLVLESSEAYTLWGQPFVEGKAQPPVRIKPGGFISLIYPVQFNSPLYGLPQDRPLVLEIMFQWGRSVEEHKLVFPMQKEVL